MAAKENQASEVEGQAPVAASAGQLAHLRALSRLLERGGCKLVGPRGEAISLPPSVGTVLERATEALVRGDSVRIVPVDRRLTTQQAANLLNVSRQYLVRLLEEGSIPFTRTGSHRRLRFDDVMAFRAQRDRQRQKDLDKLAQLSEDFGGYAELD